MVCYEFTQASNVIGRQHLIKYFVFHSIKDYIILKFTFLVVLLLKHLLITDKSSATEYSNYRKNGKTF